MKVLISAFACSPGWGSEPSTGWNSAREVANEHETWVLTSAFHRPQIEAELVARPVPSMHFEFVEWAPVPGALRWKKPWVDLLYYGWQLVAYHRARELHKQVGFDIAHHVTYGRYWMPSFLPFLGVPFVWGPVGGGESAPRSFWADLGFRGAAFEALRESARYVGECDPSLRAAARRTAFAFATTRETSKRMEKLGARTIEVMPNITLTDCELVQFGRLRMPPPDPLRFVSVGRLLPWKGVHLGIRAFAGLQDSTAEYWIVGTGPARSALASLARKLGVESRVRFLGQRPHEEIVSILGQCHALVHPSLHDSSGTVILEAMAAGRPVLCLDLGGPSVLVGDGCGFKVPSPTPEDAVAGLTAAMHRLSTSFDLVRLMGEAGRRRANAEFSARHRSRQFSRIYERVVGCLS